MRFAPGTTQTFRTIGVAVIAVLTAGGCKGKSPTEPVQEPGACGINNTTDRMSGKIDGLAWSSIIVIGQHVQNVVSITGNDGCDPSRVLTFNLFIEKAGTYKIPETDKEKEEDDAVLTAILSIGTKDGWSAQVGNGRGTVSFSTLSATSASGTFFFTLVPMVGTTSVGTKTVTDGTFTAKFTINPAILSAQRLIALHKDGLF